MMRTAVRSLVLVFASILISACGDGGGGGDVITGPSGGTCRNQETAFNATTTTVGGLTVSTATGTCTFTAATLQLACTTRTVAGGGTTTSTSTFTYGSVASLVDEVAVLPPRRLALSQVQSSTSVPPLTTMYFYDATNRLNREQTTVSMTNYTDWDDRGRPTRGVTVATNQTRVLTISYNDAARVTTTAFSSNDQVILTCSDGYDADGNQISNTCSEPAGTTATTMWTVTSTQRICK